MSDLEKLINDIENILNTQWYSDAEQDLCNGCRYFESSRHLLAQALPYLKRKLWEKEEPQWYLKSATITHLQRADGTYIPVNLVVKEENDE